MPDTNPSRWLVELPPCDEHGTPVSKMPDCPFCGHDELGMLAPDKAFCYVCHLWFGRSDA